MRKFISLRKFAEMENEDVFEKWSAEWLAATRLMSSTQQMMQHPRFHDLVELGHVAAQRAIVKLRDGDIQVHWFLLLSKITGDNPVPEEQRGVVHEMAARWVEYGEKRYSGVKRYTPEEKARIVADFSEMVRRTNEACPEGLPAGLLAGSPYTAWLCGVSYHARCAREVLRTPRRRLRQRHLPR